MAAALGRREQGLDPKDRSRGAADGRLPAAATAKAWPGWRRLLRRRIKKTYVQTRMAECSFSLEDGQILRQLEVRHVAPESLPLDSLIADQAFEHVIAKCVANEWRAFRHLYCFDKALR